MFTGENIICVSSIDWDFVWQGHQEIMSAFAEAGNRVLFIENTGIRTPSFRDIPRLRKRLMNWKKGVSGIRKVSENLYVYSPIILPFPYSSIIKPINRMLFVQNVKKWMSVADFANPIIWTFLPTNIAMDLIDNIDNKKLIVYYCIAEFAQLVSSSKKVEKYEKELLKRCDLVFAQGEKIKEHCLKYNTNVHIFPFGVSESIFSGYDAAQKNNPIMANIKGPIIGYVGGVHKHVDVALIKALAERNSKWSIVLVGPMQIKSDVFRGHRNIFTLGMKKHKELPFYISRFDVCIIPYVLNEYTKTVYPTKLNEYLIMGKPVVSTAIPEVNKFQMEHPEIVEIAENTESFIEKTEKCLNNPGDDGLRKKRAEVARESSWPVRIEKMANLIVSSIEKRYTRRAIRWREEMILFYKRLKVRVIKAVLVFSVIYLIIFKTSLLWLIASPLKMEAEPVKAGAIMVFAGGVGESGKAGQNYEERVEKAVELYKKGYAKNIVFFSGYTYTFQEADVMKALAVSLGIPPEAIILEKKAGNTYTYAKLAGSIAEQRGWKSLLLVSSPYNMRRAMLCFQSTFPDLTVIQTPVQKSHYYAYARGASLSQYNGILHEYIGILYYWVRGYIR